MFMMICIVERHGTLCNDLTQQIPYDINRSQAEQHVAVPQCHTRAIPRGALAQPRDGRRRDFGMRTRGFVIIIILLDIGPCTIQDKTPGRGYLPVPSRLCVLFPTGEQGGRLLHKNSAPRTVK